MATVTIRLDDETREDLEELAKTNGVTLSTMLRDQIDTALGREVKMQKRSDVPHSLSMQQRRILAQQHEILALLHVDDEYEAKYHHNMAEVLHKGYAGEYDSVFAAVQPELSRSECSLVWDILDMGSTLESSIDRLSDDDLKALGADDERRLRFGGFDLNDSLEGRLLYYVRYLVRTERWPIIGERLRMIGDDGNSHHPCLPSYQRMLAAYSPILEARTAQRGFSPDAWLLNLGELRQVAEAWAWPASER